MPLIWSEYNAAYDNEVAVTDSIYMGPWLATTIAQCDGLTEMMSLWTFSDVFEEQGVVKTPFYGGFGLIAAGNIPKPSFYAMQIAAPAGRSAHREQQSSNVLVTKASDGSLVVAVWNMVNPGSTGAPKTVKLQFKGMRPECQGHQSSTSMKTTATPLPRGRRWAARDIRRKLRPRSCGIKREP